MKKENQVIGVVLLVPIVFAILFFAILKVETYRRYPRVYLRITYTFAGDRNLYNVMETNCNDPGWQATEFSTCGAQNSPCVVKASSRRLGCDFKIMAPSGVRGNPTPTFTNTDGSASNWPLTLNLHAAGAGLVFNDHLSSVKTEISRDQITWKEFPTHPNSYGGGEGDVTYYVEIDPM